jgi:hypothetical protein
MTTIGPVSFNGAVAAAPSPAPPQGRTGDLPRSSKESYTSYLRRLSDGGLADERRTQTQNNNKSALRAIAAEESRRRRSR